MTSSNKTLHVGLCGAGIGGLTAAIALCRAGAQVTVLEAAAELGEIGAGIQMTPNVSRLLINWGVADVIGDDLVEVEELNIRKQDGTRVGYTKMIPHFRTSLGYPWWVVHRADLHAGLVEVALKNGAKLLTNSRVSAIDHTSNSKVTVRTEPGKEYTFDLLVGSDGINSVVRKTLFPDVKPMTPTKNSAYRAVVKREVVEKDPLVRELIEKPTMEVWMAPSSYIISYPITANQDFNLVMSHHTPHFCTSVENVSLSHIKSQYSSYDPRIQRIISMIPEAQRWPLMVTNLETWSSKEKNVLLMGDAAHSMVNHMAQGAATSMEDGAFLGVCIKAVVDGDIGIEEAVEIYEKGRMPKAQSKQNVSFLNGALWHMDGKEADVRDQEMMKGRRERSPNLYGDIRLEKALYGYDAEAHARECLERWGKGEKGIWDKGKSESEEWEELVGWFLKDKGR